MKNTTKRIVILMVITLLVSVSLTGCVMSRFEELNIGYEQNPFFNTADVYSITLTRENKNVVITIPDYTTDGAKVVEVGISTSENKYLRIFLEGANLNEYGGNPDKFLPGHTVTDYYVTLKLGKNIKRAEPLIAEPVRYFKIADTEEFIRVNIYVEVSPDNPYFYSENGVIYEK